MSTGNCQIILQGLKGYFNVLKSLHGHYRVDLVHKKIPVVITGNGFAVWASISSDFREFSDRKY